MTIYALYIRTVHTEYNILNIDEHELQTVVSAYKYAKDTFYVSGKKYTMLSLTELTIFQLKNPDYFNIEIDNLISSGKAPYNVRGELAIPPRILKRHGHDVTKYFIKQDFGYGNYDTIKEEKKQSKEMEIFISHSSSDVNITEILINIIRKALNLDSKKIRCTSVDGYKLPVGISTEEQLKNEIYDSKVFIAVITSHSINLPSYSSKLGQDGILVSLCYP